MLTGNVPDVICTFDNDADDFMRMRADVSGILCNLCKCAVKPAIKMVILQYIVYTVLGVWSGTGIISTAKSVRYNCERLIMISGKIFDDFIGSLYFFSVCAQTYEWRLQRDNI